MISYYKIHDSYFKLDSEKTFFLQVNNSVSQKAIIYGGASPAVDTLHAARIRDNWTEITEEEYNTVKAGVLSYLSAN